jgi:hypothetical protein
MRFRFSIRDLLWLTALLAMGLAWLIDRRNVAVQRDEFSQKVTKLEKLGSLQSDLIGLYQQRQELEREVQRASLALGDGRLPPEQLSQKDAALRDAKIELRRNWNGIMTRTAQIAEIQRIQSSSGPSR